MSTGLKWKKLSGLWLLSASVLCVGIVSPGDALSQQAQRKAKKAVKKPPLVQLPSGPTGRPVQQMPLDSIAAVAPQVSYENSQLTIVAPNSTLADILRAVRKQTGAEIDVPAAPERVVTRLGPGPARDVVAELLNGSRFNYVLLGSPSDQAVLTKVVLVAKSGPDNITPAPVAPETRPAITQVTNAPPQQPEQGQAAEANDADASDDSANNVDENADQPAAEAEQQQPANPPEQPGVKTPQQMLQEMQQRQLQLQQQQPPGQPPIPGSGVPPRPPQEP